MAALHRLRQGIASLRSDRESGDPALLRTWLTPDQCAASRELPRHDRNHLYRVGEKMIQRAPGNRDLIVAAFLHDLGKSYRGVHVRLIDRIAKVLLQAISPRTLQKLATPPPTRLRGGLVLAVHHPEIGARIARQLGCSDRTCWLIAHHDSAGTMDDPDLDLLATIDNATP